MKRTLYLFMMMAGLFLTACEKDEVGSTATEKVAGEWYVILPIRLTLIKPQTATHAPRITKVINFTSLGLIPFNLEELSLMPTAWEYKPSVVKRSTNAIAIIHATAIKNGVGIGMPGINPP